MSAGSQFRKRAYQPKDLKPWRADFHLVSLDPTLDSLIVPSKFYGIAAAGKRTIFVGSPIGEIARLIAHYRCG